MRKTNFKLLKIAKLWPLIFYTMKFIKTVLALLISLPLFSQESFPNNGVKSTFSPIYAFTNAHLIISSEKEIPNGTYLFNNC